MKPETHLVYTRPATIIGGPPAQAARVARGTREGLPQLSPSDGACLVEHQIGMGWCYSLRLEQLGRNLATAGGLEMQYRLGLAHAEFEARRFGRKRSE